MSNKRKFLFFSLIILSAFGLWLFCKERQRYPEETVRERYEKLGAEKDELLREQRERQDIGPR
jgi:hypothetical protein